MLLQTNTPLDGGLALAVWRKRPPGGYGRGGLLAYLVRALTAVDFQCVDACRAQRRNGHTDHGVQGAERYTVTARVAIPERHTALTDYPLTTTAITRAEEKQGVESALNPGGRRIGCRTGCVVSL